LGMDDDPPFISIFSSSSFFSLPFCYAASVLSTPPCQIEEKGRHFSATSATHVAVLFPKTSSSFSPRRFGFYEVIKTTATTPLRPAQVPPPLKRIMTFPFFFFCMLTLAARFFGRYKARGLSRENPTSFSFFPFFFRWTLTISLPSDGGSPPPLPSKDREGLFSCMTSGAGPPSKRSLFSLFWPQKKLKAFSFPLPQASLFP